ncbi:MAG: TauD/TfdA family dioxygenase [Sphingomonadaceae bacterium]|nr:TauD/TfdA family dioxygenase [Sphingomonadaceae bacterium]
MATKLAPPEQTFTTRKVHPTIGLEISGLDVSKPLDADTIAELTRLSSEYKVLIFKEQNLSSEQLGVFAQNFGDTKQIPPKIGNNRERQHNVSRLGNQEEAGAKHVEVSGYAKVARFWHTDSSWRPIPTWLTFLTAVEIPDKDGDTGFADMQAAYEALPEEKKAFLADKHMVHSWRTLRHYQTDIAAMGDDENVPPPMTHPLIRTVDGRKSLFLNGHVCYYVGGMPSLEEGEALFRELIDHATSQPFVYQHKWTVGDLVMWDDRSTMHRAMPWDYSQRRVMHRAEVCGTEPPK